MTSIAWHELTHASQLQRMISDHGFKLASEFWSTNVVQQAYNDISKDNPYGKKGDPNWQQIALSEGWANYRQWKMSRDYLGWNSISKMSWKDAPHTPSNYNLKFPRYYAQMFELLEGIGCSCSIMEKSLYALSIADFKENLKVQYPKLAEQIDQVVTQIDQIVPTYD